MTGSFKESFFSEKLSDQLLRVCLDCSQTLNKSSIVLL